tara:strand:- start:318 stop:1382 length:1065 start_codon:yes stop_codon:yes gene_type:complete
MATTFKNFASNDKINTRTLLHEAIPITGTIPSGTYGDNNVKNYSHGMFQSVYDYPFLSSSANHIFDITVGYSAHSLCSSSAAVQNSKKINIYNQMAQMLVGFDHTGSVREFDRDGDLASGTKHREVIFLNIARLLGKDELKKESFKITAATGGAPETRTFITTHQVTISDYSSSTDYRVNSPAGEYGILYTGSGAEIVAGSGVGLIYYQAGVAVLTGSIFPHDWGAPDATYQTGSDTSVAGFEMVLTGAAISASCDGFRNVLNTMEFDNTTELNSTIYFCRANHSDFNYSANPTYLTGSKIRVKNNVRRNQPISYVTSIGLYSADNELLAVAKLSEPLKKTPSNELTLRVRLDY